MSKRVILVTGANKGIGFETARQLGRAGHTVLVGARDAAKADDAVARLGAEGITADALVLDVNSSASIAQAAKHIADGDARKQFEALKQFLWSVTDE